MQQTAAGLASSVSFHSPFQELSELQGHTVSLAGKGQ